MEKDSYIAHTAIFAFYKALPELFDLRAKLPGTFTVVHLLHLYEIHAIIVVLELTVYLQVDNHLTSTCCLERV